jgi:hypothetical protein
MIKKIPTVSRRIHPAVIAAAVSLLAAGLAAVMLATR